MWNGRLKLLSFQNKWLCSFSQNSAILHLINISWSVLDLIHARGGRRSRITSAAAHGLILLIPTTIRLTTTSDILPYQRSDLPIARESFYMGFFSLKMKILVCCEKQRA